MLTAYVMIGASGSGKSTWIKNNIPAPVEICSADHWFINWEDGSYNFNPAELGQAHAECLRKFVETVQNKTSNVVCDNTNTTFAEVSPYIQIAQVYDFKVRPIFIFRQPSECFKHNEHGVPERAILLMNERLNNLINEWPQHWPKVEIVYTKEA